MAEELLSKESITLPDLVRILGDRPYPLKETVREYLEELRDRSTKAEETAAAEQAAANTPVDDLNKEDSEQKTGGSEATAVAAEAEATKSAPKEEKP